MIRLSRLTSRSTLRRLCACTKTAIICWPFMIFRRSIGRAFARPIRLNRCSERCGIAPKVPRDAAHDGQVGKVYREEPETGTRVRLPGQGHYPFFTAWIKAPEHPKSVSEIPCHCEARAVLSIPFVASLVILQDILNWFSWIRPT